MHSEPIRARDVRRMATTSNRLTDYLTAKQAGEILGLCERQVRRLAAARKISCVFHGSRWVFYKRSVELLKKSRAKRA